jgi:hypothetical protein
VLAEVGVHLLEHLQPALPVDLDGLRLGDLGKSHDEEDGRQNTGHG